jgi:hypothetical protein
MTFIRKSIAFARSAIASFFEADRHPIPGMSDLDFYLFNREARMDEAWGSERAGSVGQIGSDQIRPAVAPCLCGAESQRHPTRWLSPRLMFAPATRWFSQRDLLWVPCAPVAPVRGYFLLSK